VFYGNKATSRLWPCKIWAYIQLSGVGVLLAADRQSTSSSGYGASLWGP
jgi:hypothetical protein